jgi:hypothetical protein
MGIGSEYLIQKWAEKKRLLKRIVALGFACALLGEYASYRYDSVREAQMEVRILGSGELASLRRKFGNDVQGAVELVARTCAL